MKSGLKLREGENVIVELEAELWATSSNPIARFIGEIIRIINYFQVQKNMDIWLLQTKEQLKLWTQKHVGFLTCLSK